MTSKFFGFNIPFLNGRTILPLQTDERLIKNDILQLLLTVPGERIMRPNFGCSLKLMMFNQNTEENRSLLAREIYTTIRNFETRVSINESDVSVTADKSNENVINVSVRCNYTPQNFDNGFIISFKINTSTGNLQRNMSG